MYMYMHVVNDMYMYALFLTGSEQQMKQTLKDYLKGDWLFPWDRSDKEEEKQDSGNAMSKLGLHFYCFKW